MSRRDHHDIGRFVASLALFAFVAIVIPVGLVAVSRSRFGSANPLAGAAPPWRWFGDGPGSALGEPIGDDAVIDGLIRICLCVIWVAVTVIVVTTVLEVVHGVRHRGLAMPAVRGLGPVQQIARFVAVGIIAVLPVLTPTPSIASTIGRAPPTVDSPATTVDRAPHTVLVHPAASRPDMTTHIVQSGESVYSIAERLAGGDGARVIDIADAIVEANLGATMSPGQRFTSPAYIEEGWALQVPAAPVAPATGGAGSPAIYEVEPGDTLWDIADEQLGEPTEWPEIWERNRGRDMGGGRTFDDPNLILPGWDLEITGPVHHDDPPPAEPIVPTELLPPPDSADRADVPAGATPTPTPAAAPTTATATTTTTVVPSPSGDGANGGVHRADPDTGAPSPIRMEHAALLAAGILALVGVRRRRRLRAAMPRHRVPTPLPEVTETERRLRSIDAGERALRVDVACRAAASSLLGSGAQIGWVQVTGDGDVELRLTGAAMMPPPWTGGGQGWQLSADVPIELLGEDARRVGLPCIALVQLGANSSGADVLVDLEACATLAIEARGDQADDVVTALATGLASSMYAEVAHLIGVSLPSAALLGHRNAHDVDSVGAAFDLATALVAGSPGDDRTTFELRSLHTGGEMWEPAVMLLTSDDAPAVTDADRSLLRAGHGVAVVAAVAPGELPEAPCRLVGSSSGWRLTAFGTDIDVTPIGISTTDLDAIVEVLADADRELVSVELESANEMAWADDAREDPRLSFVERDHQIVVSLLGGVEVHDTRGTPGSFERSKTVELIAWLATHRERATRSGARTALWELDVRDATFANVVSEARRGLARLVAPPAGEEWVARTLTEQLPLHEAVVTDADLVEDRLAHARLVSPSEAVETLRPAVAMIREMPFAGTSYLWPDAEGITSNLVLLAITATSEFAGHALSLGDTEGVFWATAHGLKVLPGHEELIGLRMQAHARTGDLSGVRQEWECYERVLVADAWSDGEPAPKLLALRRQLLTLA